MLYQENLSRISIPIRSTGSCNEAEMVDIHVEPFPKFGLRQDFICNSKYAISSSVANNGKSYAASLLISSAYSEAPRPAEARDRNSTVKGAYTVDESTFDLDDGCSELGSCNASATEYSDNSDSEHEIFRVKRRLTTCGKPASDSRPSNLSEKQALRRLKKVGPETLRDNKQLEEPDRCSVPLVRNSQEISNSASLDDEREDMVPISWRVKRCQMETERHEAIHSAQLNSYPSSTSSNPGEELMESTKDAAAKLHAKRVKIRLYKG